MYKEEKKCVNSAHSNKKRWQFVSIVIVQKKRYKKTRHLALWICIYLREESLLLLYFAGLKSWLPLYITRWVFSSIWCYISLAPKSNFLLYFLSYMPCSDTSYCLSASKNIPFSKTEVNTFFKKFFQLQIRLQISIPFSYIFVI